MGHIHNINMVLTGVDKVNHILGAVAGGVDKLIVQDFQQCA